MTGDEWDSNIKSSFSYNSDVSCSHFGEKTVNSTIYPTLTANERQNCHSNPSVSGYFSATLSNAISGTYTVWLTDTNDVLSYSSSTTAITPCEDSDLVLDLIVSDGLSKCMTVPPSGINSNTIPSVCSNVISGYRCQSTCRSGYYTTGYNQCSNGTWVGDFKCVDTLPCIISTMTDDLNTANVSTQQITGVSGSGCGYSILNGTTCDLVCNAGYYGRGSVFCNNGKFISESADCSNITDSPTPLPTPSPTPLPTPSPTPLPTPSPTPSPTISPTMSPTPSPTPSPTISPTMSPTPSPTISPTPSPTISPTMSPTTTSIIYFTQTNYFYFMFPVCVITTIALIIYSINVLKSCFYNNDDDNNNDDNNNNNISVEDTI